ncbi:MAG TPA: hypothetical protein PLK28_20755 [Candidatus Rifleibacterium sp.]|nr:hypothetical protein [Candidatus Rifleibacterium sp.]
MKNKIFLVILLLIVTITIMQQTGTKIKQTVENSGSIPPFQKHENGSVKFIIGTFTVSLDYFYKEFEFKTTSVSYMVLSEMNIEAAVKAIVKIKKDELYKIIKNTTIGEIPCFFEDYDEFGCNQKREIQEFLIKSLKELFDQDIQLLVNFNHREIERIEANNNDNSKK